MPNVRLYLSAAMLVVALPIRLAFAADGLVGWTTQPGDFKPVSATAGEVTLQGIGWKYLVAPESHTDFEFSANLTIETVGVRDEFFGASWSA